MDYRYDHPLLKFLKAYERELYCKVLRINEDFHNTKADINKIIKTQISPKYQSLENFFYSLKDLESQGVLKIPTKLLEQDERCTVLMKKKMNYFFNLIETLDYDERLNQKICFGYCKKYTHYYYITVRILNNADPLLITHFPRKLFEKQGLRKIIKLTNVYREDNIFNDWF